jgi:hypothetical protein
MTFYQYIVIAILAGNSATANQIQNVCICIEMFLASVAHVYVFPVEEWHEDYKREAEIRVSRQVTPLKSPFC